MAKVQSSDTFIAENEVDPSWRKNQSEAYREYRRKFEWLKNTTPLEGIPEFPFSIEIEASYYCNLRCPFCPRVVNPGERDVKHMPPELWQKILAEAKENGLPSILMDHEAEALMNPKLPSMIREARESGIIDIWVHTNGNLMTAKKAEELIDAGLTKINFSIDAATEETYNKIRVGGTFQKVLKNLNDFVELKKKKGTHHIRTRVSFCLQDANASERKQFFDQWKDKVNMITFQDCIDFGPFEKPDPEVHATAAELEAKYGHEKLENKFVCTEPWEMPIIDVEGNVVPCGMPVREHNKDFILGNLNQGDTIKSCWNGKKMQELRAQHKRGEYYMNPMCRTCVKTHRKSKEGLEALVDKA